MLLTSAPKARKILTWIDVYAAHIGRKMTREERKKTMKITKKQEGTTLTVTLEGELNTLTAPNLEAELPADMEGVDNLVLEMAGLEYLSSAGLRVILAAQQALEDRGGVTILHASDEIKEIFEVTGFDDILNIE